VTATAKPHSRRADSTNPAVSGILLFVCPSLDQSTDSRKYEGFHGQDVRSGFFEIKTSVAGGG